LIYYLVLVLVVVDEYVFFSFLAIVVFVVVNEKYTATLVVLVEQLVQRVCVCMFVSVFGQQFMKTEET